MDLYFGSFVTIVSTVLVFVVWVFIVLNICKHKSVGGWGRRITMLALLGLITCCFVATRDNYHLSVQASFDESVTSGLFAMNSIQSIACSIGGTLIILILISCLFVKNTKYHKTMFFVLSSIVVLKTIVIEISRLVL